MRSIIVIGADGTIGKAVADLLASVLAYKAAVVADMSDQLLDAPNDGSVEGGLR